MMTVIEEVVSARNLCGEAPLWDSHRQALIWADINAGLVFDWEPDSRKIEILSDALELSGLALHAGGGLIFAGPGGMHLWFGRGQYRTFLTEHEGVSLSFNDILAEPQGRIYAGTCYWGATEPEKPGKLYLVESTGQARVVDDGIELSNGLGLSGTGRTLYYADSSARIIYASEVDPVSGELSNRREFVRVPLTEGLPDGLTVDAEDHVWSAQWYGGQIVRYDPDGKVERRIAMPVKQVSSLAFGGRDLADLYVTSAAESWSSPYAPPGYDFLSPNVGGSLYRIRLNVQERPEHQADLFRRRRPPLLEKSEP